MKKYSALIIFVIGLFFTTAVFGQTPTIAQPTATPSGSVEQKEIQNLKEKIATKVAELRKKGQKAIAGSVSNVGGQSLEIKREDESTYEVKIDEALTKIYRIVGASKKEVALKEIKKGAYIIATGPVIDKTIMANSLYQDEQFFVKVGKITEINKSDYSLKVLTTDKDTITLDIEQTTKQQMVNIKTLGIEKTGFSKFKEGDTIHFVVKSTGSEKDNTYSTYKVLVIPQEYFIK